MPCSARTALAVEQFRFEVDAVFELLGPRAKVFACTLGLPCTIELPGHEVPHPRGWRELLKFQIRVSGTLMYTI